MPAATIQIYKPGVTTLWWRVTMNCIEDQRLAREAAYNAQYYVEHGLLGRACQEQREARYHAAQAMERLERLI